jgi:hypothetical protein
MASEAYVHLERRRKRDRTSRLRADTEVLRGRRADELTRSSYRASWLFLKSIPEDPCLVGVHSLLVAVRREMTLPLAGPGPLPRRLDSRLNMRSVRLGPSYCRQRIGAFPINASRAAMAAMAAAEEKASGTKYRTLHPCGSSVAAVQPPFRRAAWLAAFRLPIGAPCSVTLGAQRCLGRAKSLRACENAAPLVDRSHSPAPALRLLHLASNQFVSAIRSSRHSRDRTRREARSRSPVASVTCSVLWQA